MNARPVLGRVWLVAAAIVVLFALAISVLRIVVPQVPAYRDDVAGWAGDLLGAPVDIGTMDVRWRRLRPELVLGAVRYVSADARHAFAAREVRVGISVRALLQGELAPARIVLVEPDITLDFAAAGGGDGAGWRRAFQVREHRGEVRVERGRVTLLADEGRRRVEFDAVDGGIASDGRDHRLRFSARPRAAGDGAVHADLHASGWPAQRDWAVDGQVSLRGLDLLALQRLGWRGRLQSGRVDLTFGIAVAGVAQRVSVELGLAAVRWSGADGAVFRVDRAAGEASWTRRADGWDAELRRFVVARGDGVQQNGPLTVAWTHTGDGTVWRVQSGGFHIEDAALLAEFLPSEPLAGFDALLARNPSGSVASATLALEVPRAGTMRYTLAARATGLALGAAVSPLPGFDGVSVTVDATADGGRATLTVADGSVSFPQVFRDALPLSALEAELAWRRAGNGDAWAIHAPTIVASNADIKARGTGTLRIPAAGARTLSLDASYAEVSLGAHARYLPVSVMPESLVAWLDRAVLAGVARTGTFRYGGEVGGAALREGRASLAAEFDAEGVTLDYADPWPVLTGGDARVRFTEQGFSGIVSAGALGGVAIARAEVAIAAFATPVLTIDAASAGPLAPMLDAFQSTPPGDARWLAAARAEGSAQLAVAAAVPLRADAAVTVRGTLAVDAATLAFGGFPHPITGVYGTLAFTADGVAADRLVGVLLGHPVTGRVETLRDGNDAARAVQVVVDGRADRATLAAVLGFPDPPVTGATQWQARILAPYDAGLAPHIEIESSLAGLAVALPKPLGKDAQSTQPVALHAELTDKVRRFTLAGGDAIGASGVLVVDGGKWRLARGRIQLGGGELGPVPDDGVTLSGRVASLRHGVSDGLPVVGADVPLTRVDLMVDAMAVYGWSLDAVRLTGQRADGAWQWAFAGERLAGTLRVPDTPTNEAPVVVDLVRVSLPARDPSTAAERVQLDARAMPPVAFHVRDFTLGPAALGELNGTIRRVENGVVLEGFVASRRDMRIAGDASWHTVDGFHRTTLRGTVDTTDVRRALDALGYGESIEASAGHLQADLNWLGSPLTDPRALLSGAVSVRIERGTLFDLQPGAGRVFGLLSLNALPRRLALDFSDVFRRGLAFDSISGSFVLDRGDAQTDDLRLVGPAARVEVRGRTGLATRDYDQEAVVVASLTSSLAIAGTLAGGPGVGAAVLLASELLRGPLEGISRAHYRVTGTWDAPEVERVVETDRGPP